MKFKEYDYKKVKIYNDLYKLLEEFRDSGLKCAILEDVQYSNAEVGARSINQSCARYNYPYIKAVVNNGQIFLINKLK